MVGIGSEAEESIGGSTGLISGIEESVVLGIDSEVTDGS